MLTLDHLNLDKMFVKSDKENDDDKNATNPKDDLKIISATELFQIYYVIWINDFLIEKKVSKVKENWLPLILYNTDN